MKVSIRFNLSLLSFLLRLFGWPALRVVFFLPRAGIAVLPFYRACGCAWGGGSSARVALQAGRHVVASCVHHVAAGRQEQLVPFSLISFPLFFGRTGTFVKRCSRASRNTRLPGPTETAFLFSPRLWRTCRPGDQKRNIWPQKMKKKNEY
jgi:hypothetical protein